MKLKNPRKKITSNLILEKFFNSDAVKELQENLNSDLKKIHFQGNVGSSFAVYSASILCTSIQNHVFVIIHIILLTNSNKIVSICSMMPFVMKIQ